MLGTWCLECLERRVRIYLGTHSSLFSYRKTLRTNTLIQHTFTVSLVVQNRSFIPLPFSRTSRRFFGLLFRQVWPRRFFLSTRKREGPGSAGESGVSRRRTVAEKEKEPSRAARFPPRSPATHEQLRSVVERVEGIKPKHRCIAQEMDPGKAQKM